MEITGTQQAADRRKEGRDLRKDRLGQGGAHSRLFCGFCPASTGTSMFSPKPSSAPMCSTLEKHQRCDVDHNHRIPGKATTVLPVRRCGCQPFLQVRKELRMSLDQLPPTY